ncbi:MAG: hypothetical protein RR203_02450 [Synergistaceae bacterium]
MAKITAPNKKYNGVTATVHFIDGEGESKDTRLLEWFETHGYKVSKEKVKSNSEEKPEEKQTEKKK